jgi:hypothetical protein
VIVFTPPLISIELVRQRERELQAAAEQHRRLHPERSRPSGRGWVATNRRVATGIHRVLVSRPGRGARTDGALQLNDAPSQ